MRLIAGSRAAASPRVSTFLLMIFAIAILGDSDARPDGRPPNDFLRAASAVTAWALSSRTELKRRLPDRQTESSVDLTAEDCPKLLFGCSRSAREGQQALAAAEETKSGFSLLGCYPQRNVCEETSVLAANGLRLGDDDDAADLLQLYPKHMDGRRRREPRPHECLIADEEKVCTLPAIGRCQPPPESIVAVQLKACTTENLGDRRRLVLYQHRLELRRSERHGGTPKHLGLIALHVELSQDRCLAIEGAVEGVHTYCPSRAGSGGNYPVRGVESGRRARFTWCRAEGCLTDGDETLEAIERQISAQRSGGLRVRLEGHSAGTADAGSEYGIAADVGTDVSEEIAGPEEVEHKGHISEFVQAGVDVAGGTSHAATHSETRPLDPRHDQFGSELAHDLPVGKADERAELSVASQRMSGKEASGADNGAEHGNDFQPGLSRCQFFEVRPCSFLS
jgi:hypothetical protein